MVSAYQPTASRLCSRTCGPQGSQARISKLMTQADPQLELQLAEAAVELSVPGAAVGVCNAGQLRFAFHGVTSVENPLPVDERTLFQLGSAAKTFTATAIMRLVAQGRVRLEERVRCHERPGFDDLRLIVASALAQRRSYPLELRRSFCQCAARSLGLGGELGFGNR